MKFTDFRNLIELRAIFPSADQIGKFTVFNVGGNKARLVAAILYNTGKIYVRHILTLKEYDKDAWKEE
jgi:mRNA interferase HigB